MQPTEEQLKTILKVIDRIAPKYIFGFYDLDDIKQESYIICLEILPKYDNVRPFENFVSRHLSNRLKDLIRNKYSRKGGSDRHKQLIDSKKNLTDLKEMPTDFPFYERDAGIADSVEKILEELSPSMRNDWNRLLNGVPVQSARKANLFKRVKEILGEDW